ncbi:SDR family NAD(P)-dependent oxidoreductase [Tsuneonella suprasediminis]|uniref:SDR family NAD(P)-dependent oxidoreductase n=1 Tax=Tsuneonella suprasediminis TaxID=2306996 RepID=A0A419R3Q9_9SPHN|nr:SDR family NAD(P)-dependent oxidoreductase [Tsuneonella suprasediminis]RJX69173.1 SDR family NAD(P)-dependent oxidoreductase [Tsuneonella suprasediminis]
MRQMVIFGLGYTATRIAAQLQAAGWQVSATGSAGDIDFEDDAAVTAALAGASHVLSSVPPADGVDPVLARYGDSLHHEWIGYFSSTGVYGDTGGAWVDETAAVVGRGGSGRRAARSDADAAWLAKGARVLRLPGIYGPGRSAFDKVRDGTARRIDMPGQVFSRVHVDDIASGALAALSAPPGAYNLADDLPASGAAVTEEACRLLRVVPPPLQSISEAGLSPAARGFYSENRRVANGKARRVLGWRPRYRDYTSGLAAILAAEGTDGN